MARYSQGLSIDEPLAMLRGGTTSYYQADGLGSVTSLTNTAGAAAQAYTYDSFGNIVATTGSLTNSFRYTGREFDAETSLYYYRARHLHQSVGRFLNEDPIRSAGGINFYSYALSNPIRFTDPNGTCIVDIYFEPVYRLGQFLGFHSFMVLTDSRGTSTSGTAAWEYRAGPGDNGELFPSNWSA